MYEKYKKDMIHRIKKTPRGRTSTHTGWFLVFILSYYYLL